MSPQRPELGMQRDALMEAKREQLADVKAAFIELFGEEQMPKELVQALLDVRRGIAEEITSAGYLDHLSPAMEQAVRDVTLRIANYRSESADDASRALREDEQALADGLSRYFDSYRMAQNATTFRANVASAQEEIVAGAESRVLNFYSKEEKSDELVDRLLEKYRGAGFAEDEIRDLLKIYDVKRLDELQVQDIQVIAKIRDIFSRFMDGDRAKYVTLSAGLLVPAFLEGYAPSLLANAFEGDRVNMQQIALYAMATMSAVGGSVFVNKQFTEFFNTHFAKEGGAAEMVATNVAEFPAEQIQTFGVETVKQRVAAGRATYEEVYRLISFDVFPATITLVTSAYMLYDKHPMLAAGTAVSTTLMMGMDNYLSKRFAWWGKQRKAEREAERMARQMEEQLNAHMEVILSGMKDDMIERLEDLLSRERVATSEKQIVDMLRMKYAESFRVVNMVTASAIAALTGGSFDKFIAALVYSGNFQQNIGIMLSARRNLQSAFRDMSQMELMFNGYAAEEQEREKTRVGMETVPRGALTLRDIVVRAGRKEILSIPSLDIPEGSMAHLEGASGAGKTTLMKVLSGYYRPTAGEVRMSGVDLEDIKKSGEDSLYASICYLPQFPTILEDNVRNNIRFGLREAVPDVEIRKVLTAVGLQERFTSLEEPLKGGHGDAGTASGGETARLGLARVLLKIRNSDARVVFLDEPTASVDRKTMEDIAKVIKQEKAMRPGVTFIVISHQKEFIDLLGCDMDVRMEKGKVW